METCWWKAIDPNFLIHHFFKLLFLVGREQKCPEANKTTSEESDAGGEGEGSLAE